MRQRPLLFVLQRCVVEDHPKGKSFSLTFCPIKNDSAKTLAVRSAIFSAAPLLPSKPEPSSVETDDVADTGLSITTSFPRTSPLKVLAYIACVCGMERVTQLETGAYLCHSIGLGP